MMKIVVGLGNPGREYERTRHNIGFAVIDELVRRYAGSKPGRSRFQSLVYEARLSEERVLLMKPMQYMNRSGGAISEVVRFHKEEPSDSLLVIVDDVALALGEIRVRADGSAGTHNGLADIQQKLGTTAYARIRIGIDDPGIVSRVNYVLGRFTPDEEPIVADAVTRASDAVVCWVEHGIVTTMNEFNRRISRRRNVLDDESGSNGRDPDQDQ
jgi:PTH1 family peptidyl-tRNA hydrolase